MRWMKWAGIMAAIVLVISCFIPWVFIEAKQITVSGMASTGTHYGKPGYFHLLMCFFFIVLSFIPRVWAKRGNLLVVAMNFAWAVRNFFLITSCEAGECPIKKAGIYLVALSSLIIIVSALFPDMSLKPAKDENPLGKAS